MPKNIMVVEDDAEIRGLYVEILENEGYEVIPAEDGVKAMTLLKTCNCKPCLVVTDFMMPHMNGIELINGIRKDDLLCGTPVMMVSAVTDRPQIDVDFIRKPVDLDQMLQKIEKYCNTSHQACNCEIKRH